MTLPIYDKAHKHNAPYCQVLRSLIDGKLMAVQYRRDGGFWQNEWTCVDGMPHPTVWTYEQVRIKPPEPVMITRTVTYPAPIRKAPDHGRMYWLAGPDGLEDFIWEEAECEVTWLKAGVCFTTQADAQACWDALFGGVK